MVLPQSLPPPSLGKKVHSIVLPNMPMGAVSASATIHNRNVYIIARSKGKLKKAVYHLFVCSTNEHKWSTLPVPHAISSVAVVNNSITSIGGFDLSTGKAINMLSTWNEEEGQWKQVLPSMPTGRFFTAVISHDNLLLVTGGLGEDCSTVLNTCDVLDLTTMKWTTPEGLNLPTPLWRQHLALCGEYIYMVGEATAVPFEGLEQHSPQAWRAKWSDVKQTALPQQSQPRKSVWTRIANPPTLAPPAVSCGGTLYTVGGQAGDGTGTRGIYAYNTTRNQWISVGDMSTGRYDHCAVPLTDTAIFVAGGSVLNEGKVSFSSSTELLLL